MSPPFDPQEPGDGVRVSIRGVRHLERGQFDERLPRLLAFHSRPSLGMGESQIFPICMTPIISSARKWSVHSGKPSPWFSERSLLGLSLGRGLPAYVAEYFGEETGE